MSDWPSYRCQRFVQALKIAEVNVDAASQVWLVPEDTNYAEFKVDHDFVMKHKPEPGGYFVRFDQSHESWSPADLFENGFTEEA